MIPLPEDPDQRSHATKTLLFIAAILLAVGMIAGAALKHWRGCL